MEEGYIKFKADWERSPALPLRFFKRLNHWRNILFDHNLIGAYENGIGFGNISERLDKKGRFIISGSATGIYPALKPAHYSMVTRVDIKRNTLSCHGPVIASSESMSHAVIYLERPETFGVIHVHHRQLWERLLHEVPTTDKTAAYGTPEMALSIIDLLKTTDLSQKKIFVMEGHEEGIFTFGKDLDEAGNILLEYYKKVIAS